MTTEKPTRRAGDRAAAIEGGVSTTEGGDDNGEDVAVEFSQLGFGGVRG